MAVYERTDSPYWYLWLETAPVGQQRERTKIRKGTTAAARTDSRRLAEDLYHERMRELARKIHRLPDRDTAVPTFAALAATYDADAIEHHRGKEREREILTRLVAAFGDRSITELTPEIVRPWRTRRLKTPTVIEHFGGPKGPRKVLPPPGARTVNREIDLLQQIVASGVPTYFDRSPLEGLKDLDIVKPIRRLMTEPEERKILAQLEPIDRAIVICGLDTLARFGDILDLERTDDRGTHLDFRLTKNGDPVSVPVSKRLRKALDAIPAHASKYLFWARRQAETERDRRRAFAGALKRACQAADVDYGRAARGITFHWATRRTGATRMIRRGGDKMIKTVQTIGSWKTPNVLIGIYQETSEAEMRAAVESVSARRRAK